MTYLPCFRKSVFKDSFIALLKSIGHRFHALQAITHSFYCFMNHCKQLIEILNLRVIRIINIISYHILAPIFQNYVVLTTTQALTANYIGSISFLNSEQRIDQMINNNNPVAFIWQNRLSCLVTRISLEYGSKVNIILNYIARRNVGPLQLDRAHVYN